MTNERRFELVFSLLSKYIPETAQKHIKDLPIPMSVAELQSGMSVVRLPAWAVDVCPAGFAGLMVPTHCINKNVDHEWQGVDWLRAVFDMVTSQFERSFEREVGPIHSYSSKLPKDIHGMFSHAWVNRIALFLRCWAAHIANVNEDVLFGMRPTARVYLTHDVDYVSKTMALRLKQTVFNVFNAMRNIKSLDFKACFLSFRKASNFLFGSADYWQFGNIVELENKYDVKSYWNFYGGYKSVKSGLSKVVMDPAYDIGSRALVKQIRYLKSAGHFIGLHQSFFSWNSCNSMGEEKKYIEDALGDGNIDICRQHWLRFSFADTWLSQEKAGIKLDMTLGFNNSPGFRNGAALRAPYWNQETQCFSTELETIPMVLMDSHLFDYQQSSLQVRRKMIDRVLEEVDQTGGEVSIIWHQRVFHKDYGWGDDYEYLLQRASDLGLV